MDKTAEKSPRYSEIKNTESDKPNWFINIFTFCAEKPPKNEQPKVENDLGVETENKGEK